jgi:uncharacterized protein YjbI with pentapeptide repeats
MQGWIPQLHPQLHTVASLCRPKVANRQSYSMAQSGSGASGSGSNGPELQSFASRSSDRGSTTEPGKGGMAVGNAASARRIAFAGAASLHRSGSDPETRDPAVSDAARPAAGGTARASVGAGRGHGHGANSSASSTGSRRSRTAAAGDHGLAMPTESVAGHRAPAVQSPASHALTMQSPSTRAVGADDSGHSARGRRPAALVTPKVGDNAHHGGAFGSSSAPGAVSPPDDSAAVAGEAFAASIAPTDLSSGLDRPPLLGGDSWGGFPPTGQVVEHMHHGQALSALVPTTTPSNRPSFSPPHSNAAGSAGDPGAPSVVTPQSAGDPAERTVRATPGAGAGIQHRRPASGRSRSGAGGSGAGSAHGQQQQQQSPSPSREAMATRRGRIVRLNVGGTVFATTRETLMQQPGSLLCAIASDEETSLPVDEDGCVFVDRDPGMFGHVLNALRDGAGECALPEDRASLTRLWSEARFYGVTQLEDEIEQELTRLASKPISRGLVLQLLHSSSDGRLQLPATKLTGLVLSFLRLCDSILTGSDCSGADLSGSDLSRCQATFASFAGANMTSATLAEARLEQAVFRGACLVRATATGADLRGADFRGCDLRRANLTSASVKGAMWEGATLEKAVVISVDLRSSDMSGLVLREANMEGSDLSGAILCGADLSRANLWGCQGLESADLSGANLTGAILPPVLRAEGRLASQVASGAGMGLASRPPRHAVPAGGAADAGAVGGVGSGSASAAAAAAATLSAGADGRSGVTSSHGHGSGGAVGLGGAAAIRPPDVGMHRNTRVVTSRHGGTGAGRADVRAAPMPPGVSTGAGAPARNGAMSNAGRAVIGAGNGTAPRRSTDVTMRSINSAISGPRSWRDQATHADVSVLARRTSGSVMSSDDPGPLRDSPVSRSGRFSSSRFDDDAGSRGTSEYGTNRPGAAGSQSTDPRVGEFDA